MYINVDSTIVFVLEILTNSSNKNNGEAQFSYDLSQSTTW